LKDLWRDGEKFEKTLAEEKPGKKFHSALSRRQLDPNGKGRGTRGKK
jgi:hypothetical protein